MVGDWLSLIGGGLLLAVCIIGFLLISPLIVVLMLCADLMDRWRKRRSAEPASA